MMGLKAGAWSPGGEARSQDISDTSGISELAHMARIGQLLGRLGEQCLGLFEEALRPGDSRVSYKGIGR